MSRFGDWCCIVSKATGMRGPFPGEYPEAEAKELLASLKRNERVRYKLLKVGRSVSRPGRFFEVGPVEIETRIYTDRHVFFDPIGTANYVGCTYRPDAEIEAMEERDEPGWWKTENWLTPDSKPPTYGGNFEFNVRGYRISFTVWWRRLYGACTWLNGVLLRRAERKYG